MLVHYSVPDVSTLSLYTLSWESYRINDLQELSHSEVPVWVPLVGSPLPLTCRFGGNATECWRPERPARGLKMSQHKSNAEKALLIFIEQMNLNI